MATKSSFWSSFWRETGKNSGKFLSNKVFGEKWSTPYRHEITRKNSFASADVAPKKESKPVNETSAPTFKTTRVFQKNVATNEHDVDIVKIQSEKSLEFFAHHSRESKKVSNRSMIFGLSVVILTAATLFIGGQITETKRISNEQMHLKLEKIEFEINSLIKKGKTEEASELIFQLEHPSESVMPGTGKVSDLFLGIPTYKKY